MERGTHNIIDKVTRACNLCNVNIVEDEYHFILTCPFYTNSKQRFIPDKLYPPATCRKFIMLMASTNYKVIKKLVMYLYNALILRNDQRAFLNL